MGYSLEHSESVRDGVCRVVRELAEENLRHVASDDDIHERIHEIRKNFKKVRAAFRLVRPVFGGYGEENRRYRDAGRLLSDLRDATARIETVDQLRGLLLEAVDGEAPIDALRAALVQARDDAFAEASIDELLADVEERTRGGMQALDDVSLDAEGFAAVAGGLRKSYRRGCDMFEKAKTEPSVETFHTWRKRVKYHRYHVDLLENLWKPALHGWEEALHELTDDLGRANDLAVLDAFIAAHPDAVDPEGELVAALNDANAAARRRALARGGRAYAETPDALVGRFRDYWAAWKPA